MLLQPRDPAIFRDARPFAAEPGARAFSLTWPFPRTVAGAIRTHLLTDAIAGPLDWRDREAGHDAARRAQRIAVHGPLRMARFKSEEPWRVYVPAPADVVPYRETVEAGDGTDKPSDTLSFLALRPETLGEGEGCDLPAAGQEDSPGKARALSRVKLKPMRVAQEIKPDAGSPSWWPLDSAARWLGTAGDDEADIRAALSFDQVDGKEVVAGLDHVTETGQTHVAIDTETDTGIEGALFTTESRAFRDAPSTGGEIQAGSLPEQSPPRISPADAMLCRVVGMEPHDTMQTFLPLGGERRLTYVEPNPPDAAWPAAQIPDDASRRAARGLRLQLVTPAIFTHGWLPGWMADGTVPGLKGMGIELELVGAAIDRRVPVSGWRMGRDPGPRAVSYAVPAGGVYFFELKRGELTPDLFSALWLQPVSDLEVHRHQGFGLVLPGIW